MAHLRIAMTVVLVFLVGCLGITEGCEERRDQRLQPDRVLDAVGLKAGMTVAEVGAGRGYFAVKLARGVGPEGHVYANDIDSDALETLSERCVEENLHNVTVVHGDIDDPRLPSNSLDMVFFVYALHDFTQPVDVLKNLRPSLRSGATAVVLDQNPEITGDDHFLEAERVIEIFTEAGYHLSRQETFLERDLLMIFSRSP